MALLPTGHYLVGGAMAVAVSFILLAFVPARIVDWLASARLRLGSLPAITPVPVSLASFAALVVLVLAGLYGSRDPLANPLPTMVWTMWWVGVTLLHAVLGNLWAYINPWTGPLWVIDRSLGGRVSRSPPLSYPAWLGYWPAIALFFAFAWFELVDPAPDDPGRLAYAVAGYWLVSFTGMVLFGEAAWRERAEPFSIFYRLIAGLSPLVIAPSSGRQGRYDVSLALPGAALIKRDALPLSGVLFVLLTLSAVSFDGLSATFWWLSLGDINPLEFPGRTDVMHRNTVGLLMTVVVLGAGFVAAIRFGWFLAGAHGPVTPGLGSFIYSIMPIALAFHFSHYLAMLLIGSQYALLAMSDPFATGADLFGLGHFHVVTSFMATYEGTRMMWNLQTAGIVVGHVAAVVLAHALAVRHFGDNRSAVLSQLPLAVLMVLYTALGLWLLSTPVAG
jgi:hypothetical protein